MKISFRLECPHCKWGHPWHDKYVNMGWVNLTCHHCEKKFYTKIAITGVDVNTQKEPPEELLVNKLPIIFNNFK